MKAVLALLVAALVALLSVAPSHAEKLPILRRTWCGKYQITCGDGSCLSKSKTCDGVADCNDGADETAAYCITSGPAGVKSCGRWRFRCDNGWTCLPWSQVCDGTSDCTDNRDEVDCSVSAPCDSKYQVSVSGTCTLLPSVCDVKTLPAHICPPNAIDVRCKRYLFRRRMRNHRKCKWFLSPGNPFLRRLREHRNRMFKRKKAILSKRLRVYLNKRPKL